MIIKFRKIIAFHVALFLVVISLGFIKPNFSGEPTTKEPAGHDGYSISQKVET